MGYKDKATIISIYFLGLPLLIICGLEGLILNELINIPIMYSLILINVLLFQAIIYRIFTMGYSSKIIRKLEEKLLISVIITVSIIPLFKLISILNS